jgi:hypothetical protein
MSVRQLPTDARVSIATRSAHAPTSSGVSFATRTAYRFAAAEVLFATRAAHGSAFHGSAFTEVLAGARFTPFIFNRHLSSRRRWG